jgi:hypothetical protein
MSRSAVTLVLRSNPATEDAEDGTSPLGSSLPKYMTRYPRGQVMVEVNALEELPGQTRARVGSKL